MLVSINAVVSKQLPSFVALGLLTTDSSLTVAELADLQALACQPHAASDIAKDTKESGP